jgi:hypothetical protein
VRKIEGIPLGSIDMLIPGFECSLDTFISLFIIHLVDAKSELGDGISIGELPCKLFTGTIQLWTHSDSVAE